MADEELKFMGKYPTMVYDPNQQHDTANPIYKICRNADEVPDGWVDNLSKCKGGSNHGRQDGNGPSQEERVHEDEQVSEPDSSADADGSEKSATSGESADGKRGHEGVKKAPAKKAPAKKAPAKKKAAPKVTLKSLDISREEANTLLEEEGAEVAEDATDEEVAAAVAKLL